MIHLSYGFEQTLAKLLTLYDPNIETKRKKLFFHLSDVVVGGL